MRALMRSGLFAALCVLDSPSAWAQKPSDQRALAAAGGIDSFAVGALQTDTASGFSYASFGIGLLRAAVARSGPDSNRILSPFGAGQALAVALLAARDSTELAMRETLRAEGLSARSMAGRNRWMNDHFAGRSDLILKVANAVWVDTSEKLKPDFEATAAREYQAAVREIPLTSPEVVALLNRWADSTTAGRIRAVRDKPFPRSTSVVLTNAVYLKSTWLTPFDRELTKDRPFTRSSGGRLSLPAMETTALMGYRRGESFQAIRLSYKAGLTALYVVLPDSGRSALYVLDRLATNGWPMPSGREDAREVHLLLPKVHVEQATNLIPPLTALGMGIAFDSTRADFAGLVQPRADRPPECPPLSRVGTRLGLTCTLHFISGAGQHIYFDMDEEGTEAAAVTAVEMGFVVTSVPPPPLQFIVDRPFLFALRDERTGAFLFVGYVADPASDRGPAATRPAN